MSDFSSLIGQYIQYQIVSFDYDYDEGVLDAEVEISNCVDQIAEIINCNNKIIIKSIVDIIKIDNFWMFENNKLISCDRKGNKVEKNLRKKMYNFIPNHLCLFSIKNISHMKNLIKLNICINKNTV